MCGVCADVVVWVGCRYHIVEEFNKGVYDYIIATDEGGGAAERDTDDESGGEAEGEEGELSGEMRYVRGHNQVYSYLDATAR